MPLDGGGEVTGVCHHHLCPFFTQNQPGTHSPGGLGSAFPPGGSRVIPQELYKILALQIQPQASNPGAAPPQGM